MVTVIWSDTEGWKNIKQVESVEDGENLLLDEGVDVNNHYECSEMGWNPSPTLIVGDNHEIKQYDGFQY
jgi:hypothetical protein